MINNWNKIALVCLCILLGMNGFSQSKKEQIDQLRKDVDSLNSMMINQGEELKLLREYIDENNDKTFNLKIELDNQKRESTEYRNTQSRINNSLARIGSQNSVNQKFDVFLNSFLETCYWGKNIDSLAFVSADEIEQYLHPVIGLARYFNPGAFCYLHQGDLGYYFEDDNIGSLKPGNNNYKFNKETLVEDGFCDESSNADGVYYKSIKSFPDYYDPSQEYDQVRQVTLPGEYMVTQKVKVEILHENWIDKIMYFAEIDGVWYLVYFMDCDCSA